MTDQQRSANPYPMPTGGPQTFPLPPVPPGGPSSPSTPPSAPRRRNGLLFGCLGALLLVFLLGLVAAGGAFFVVRRTAARAQQVLGTSVISVSALATFAAQPTAAVAAGGPRQVATGTVATAGGGTLPRATAALAPVGGKGATVAPTSRPAAAHPAGLNEAVSVPNWKVTATGVERPGQNLIWATDNDPAIATGTWVVVVLSVTRTTNGTEAIGYDDVALRSGQGFTYAIPEEFWTLDNFYPTFKHGQPYFKVVPSGATVTYYLTFDVPPTATDLQFIFLPGSANPAVIAIGGASR